MSASRPFALLFFKKKKLGFKTLQLCVSKFSTLPEVKQFSFMESVLNHKLFQNFHIFRLFFIESSVKIRVLFHFLWCKTCNKLKVLQFCYNVLSHEHEFYFNRLISKHFPTIASISIIIAKLCNKMKELNMCANQQPPGRYCTVQMAEIKFLIHFILRFQLNRLTNLMAHNVLFAELQMFFFLQSANFMDIFTR